MATLEMEFRKMTKTPAHAFQTKSKPTGAWTQTQEVRAGKMQRNNGSTKDQAVKKTRHGYKYRNAQLCTTHTHIPQRHQESTQLPESMSKPEAGRKSSP